MKMWWRLGWKKMDVAMMMTAKLEYNVTPHNVYIYVYNMYILYIYIHTYIYIYTYIYTYSVYVYVYTYICMYTYVYFTSLGEVHSSFWGMLLDTFQAPWGWQAQPFGWAKQARSHGKSSYIRVRFLRVSFKRGWKRFIYKIYKIRYTRHTRCTRYTRYTKYTRCTTCTRYCPSFLTT
jgi:hypothetical protein